MLFPVLVFSQSPSDKLNDEKEQLLPGSISLISFKIENNSPYNKLYDIVASTSVSTITPVIKQNQLNIAARDTALYIVPIRIAPETLQGSYKIALHITDKDEGSSFTKSSDIAVARLKKIALTAIESPEYVRAGKPISSSFQLKNNGNTTEHLILESNSNITDTEDSITLQPGASKIITVTKNTDPNLGKNEMFNLTLSAYSISEPHKKWQAYSATHIISAKPLENDIYYRFPVSVSVSYVGMQNRGTYNGGFQGEIYGSGSLGQQNKDWLTFRAVSPNPVQLNAFTQYEEYFVDYKTQHLFIHLGDKTFSSSFLTEFARYGRGAEVRYKFKKTMLGGFYSRPRFFRDIKEEFNIFSTLLLNKGNEITAGYLYKIPEKNITHYNLNPVDITGRAHLPYLKATFHPLKNIRLLTEISYSQTAKYRGAGYMLQSQAYLKNLDANVSYIKTSPGFAGYFNNTNMLNGSLRFSVSKKTDLMANYIQDAKNIQRDTLTLSAPYREYIQYGANYKYVKTGTVALLGGLQKYQDRLEPKQFDYKEDFVRISINQKVSIFHLNIEHQFGKTTNFLTRFTGNSNYYTANVSFEKFSTSFNVYASLTQTSRYLLKNQKRIYYGARLFSRLSDKTSLSLFYQNNYQPEEYYNDRNLFEALFHQQILGRHEIDLSGRYTLARGETGKKDFILSLRYTLRLNVPVQKTATYTSLYGNISNQGVKKTEGVRLMLGNQLTVTDRLGNYIFKNVVPGDHILEIDRSTTDISDIPNISLPATLHLTGKENTFNFGLTTAATIKGFIKLAETGKKNNTAPVKKKNNSIIIEASDNQQVYRKICPLSEFFDFTYLRPGSWTIKIYRNGLDKNYKIPTETFRFTLEPGETKIINIDVVKQQAEIKYQHESIKVTYHQKNNR
ncbi:hypothetical protein GCM10027516_16180 [Niabella aquatica]